MPGTKKPATKAGSSGFQVHTGTSEIMYMVPKPGSNTLLHSLLYLASSNAKASPYP
jgi:hypothetical protein